jgi:hypothetical protein
VAEFVLAVGKPHVLPGFVIVLLNGIPVALRALGESLPNPLPLFGSALHLEIKISGSLFTLQEEKITFVDPFGNAPNSPV